MIQYMKSESPLSCFPSSLLAGQSVELPVLLLTLLGAVEGLAAGATPSQRALAVLRLLVAVVAFEYTEFDIFSLGELKNGLFCEISGGGKEFILKQWHIRPQHIRQPLHFLDVSLSYAGVLVEFDRYLFQHMQEALFVKAGHGASSLSYHDFTAFPRTVFDVLLEGKQKVGSVGFGEVDPSEEVVGEDVQQLLFDGGVHLRLVQVRNGDHGDCYLPSRGEVELVSSWPGGGPNNIQDRIQAEFQACPPSPTSYYSTYIGRWEMGAAESSSRRWSSPPSSCYLLLHSSLLHTQRAAAVLLRYYMYHILLPLISYTIKKLPFTTLPLHAAALCNTAKRLLTIDKQNDKQRCAKFVCCLFFPALMN